MVYLIRPASKEYQYGFKRWSGAAAGDVVNQAGAKTTTNTQPIAGILVDEPTTDNPRDLLTVQGRGAIIGDLLATAAAVNTAVYSDGAGGVDTTAPAAGVNKMIVGYVWGDEDGGTSKHVRVDPGLQQG